MLKELFKLSGFPYLSQEATPSIKEKIFTVLKVYGLIFLSLLFVGPLTYLADTFVTHVIHAKSIRQQNDVSFQHLIQKLGYGIALLYICIIGPILEETIFRLPLSFKRGHIALGISVAIFLFGSVLQPVKGFSHSIGAGYALLIRLALVPVIYFIIKKLLPVNLSIGPAYKKAFIIISICLFGLMHVSNYSPLQWQLIWIYPIYVLPQLIMGWGITYIRFKNGFIWGIALHCLINSVAMGLSYLDKTHTVPVKVHPVHVVIKKV